MAHRSAMEDRYVKRLKTPNVYLKRDFHPARRARFLTGVPAFLGIAKLRAVPAAPDNKQPGISAPVDTTAAGQAGVGPPPPHLLTLWSHFQQRFETPPEDSTNPDYLANAVRGFFQNGGEACYVVPLADHSDSAVREALESLEALHTLDLVCAPDLVTDLALDWDAKLGLQQRVVNHCETMGERFAILDSLPPGDDARGNPTSQSVHLTSAVKQWSAINGHNGALYYPWIKVRAAQGLLAMPPCGHIAGVYSRTDRERGVFKAPANAVLEGVVDLTVHLNNAGQGPLNENGINCLRMFPGRGIRVWGARTLSNQQAWSFVSVRRTFLTAVRWIEWNMRDIVFEDNDERLWGRIERELYTYFMDLLRRGALQGNSPEEAFYVKCNAETNPPELRDRGQVVTEIGLAPANPLEFVVVRLILGATGVTITGPEGLE